MIDERCLLQRGITKPAMLFYPEAADLDIERILTKHGYGEQDARTFRLETMGRNAQTAEAQKLGELTGTLHISTDNLAVDPVIKALGSILYIHTLFTEPAYTRCGIASEMLVQVPFLVSDKMGCQAATILLAPVPQYRDETGKITGIPLGIEFFTQTKGLLDFYFKQKFIRLSDTSFLYKPISL